MTKKYIKSVFPNCVLEQAVRYAVKKATWSERRSVTYDKNGRPRRVRPLTNISRHRHLLARAADSRAGGCREQVGRRNRAIAARRYDERQRRDRANGETYSNMHVSHYRDRANCKSRPLCT